MVKSDYLYYLQEVLGIQNILLPSNEDSAQQHFFFTAQGPLQPEVLRDFECVFLNILTQPKESLFNPPVAELFEKIKVAMKLSNVQLLEVDCVLNDRSRLPSELAKICQSKLVVVFSSFPKDIGEFVLKGPARWLETYSPAYLLEDSAAKRVVWNDMQKLMRELGIM